MCPGCGARVGGFDYVGGQARPVYIVKSKVRRMRLFYLEKKFRRLAVYLVPTQFKNQ